MAEVKLSDGTLIKTPKSVAELHALLIPADSRFVQIEDREGNEYNVNREQIVFMRDNGGE